MIVRAPRAALAVLAVIAAVSCSAHSSKTPATSAASIAPNVAPSGDLLSEVRQRGALIIAADANYRPQSVREPDGSWSGFDIDVGREIARRLGVKPDFNAANFNLTVRGHWNGKWDVVVSSMSVTNERSKVLWFSKSYYRVPGSIAVSKSSEIGGITDLAGKKVGVAAATTFQSYLQGKLSGKLPVSSLHLRVVPYDTDLHALKDLSLRSGARIDAVMTSLPTINAAIGAGLPIRALGSPVFEDRPAIAVDRSSFHESLGLLFAIDAIIDAMHRDGTLRRLSMKYYGMDLSR